MLRRSSSKSCKNLKAQGFSARPGRSEWVGRMVAGFASFMMVSVHWAIETIMPEMRVEEPRQADAMAKLSHPGVAFTDFVQVKLIEEIGFTVATSERFDAYGAGDDVSSALAELASMLVDEYQELSNSDMPLSTHLRLKLQALSALIRPA